LKITWICPDASSSSDRTLAEREHGNDAKSEKTIIVTGALSRPAEPTGQIVDIAMRAGSFWHPAQAEAEIAACGLADAI